MNIQQIIIYLEDLKKDILDNENNPKYMTHKVWVLIAKLQQAKKEEQTFKEILS